MVRKFAFGVISAALLSGAGYSGPARAQTPSYIVFFPEWSGAIDHAALKTINDAATAAKAPGARVTVTGHADNKGSQAANEDLSRLRAQVVMDALVADGVPSAQISAGAGGQLATVGVIDRRVEIAVSNGR